MDWLDIAPHFEPDGFLRDIYVPDSSIEDWQAVWTLLFSHPDRLAFLVDGVAEAPSRAVADVFAARSKHSILAAYSLGGQTLNCHFFDEAEIEFDIDPRQVDGPGALALADFMAAIGRLISKPVILTQENDQAAVIARFDPETDSVQWNSTSTGPTG